MIAKLKQWMLPLRRRATLAQLKRRGKSALIAPGRCGFFGNLFITVNGIRMCEAAGVQPIPNWDQRCLYFERERGSNAWDYFFQPIPPLTSESATPADDSFELSPDAGIIYPLYPALTIRESYHECFRKFAKLRDEVLEPMESMRRTLLGAGTSLGVHIRLTDAATAVEGRVTSGLQAYMEAIDRNLEVRSEAKLFVATDSVDALNSLRQRYGDRVLYLDCIRSQGAQSIHGHYDAGVPGSPYRKGLEVIQDAVMLASTQHLIRGHSRVTAYSLCINPTLTFENILGQSDDQRASWLAIST
jgi:hypothetical protein